MGGNVAASRIIRSLVLDASALSAASDENSLLRFQVRKAAHRGARLRTTSATVSQVLRGKPRDAKTNQFLSAIDIQVVDEKIGRGAGTRIGQASIRGNVTIDAIVVEVASRLPKPVAIMTSDFKDINGSADPGMMILDLAN
jgi:predicted nucleic acid-binding protein